MMLLVGCSNGSGAPSAQPAPSTPAPTAITAPPRPMSVPPTAQFVAGPLALGDPSPAANVPRTAQHVLYAVHCEQDVVVVSTTRETLYAELPCSKVLADEVFRPFLSQPVLIRVYGAEPRQLSLASATIGSLAFEVGGVWLATP